MSRHRLAPRIFKPQQPVVARKHFRLAGRSFDPGQTVRWKFLGVSQRRIRILYENGFLTHDDVQIEAPTEDTVAAAEGFDMELTSDELVIDEDLEAINKLKDLQAIAEEMNLEKARSKDEQREIIQVARNAAG